MKKIVKLFHLGIRRLLAVWRSEIYPPAEPLPRGRSFWLAFGLVTLAGIAYSIYFSALVVSKQNAFLTNGEDLGIMDQAIWSTLHGSLLHQTICNILTDTNCYGLNGVNRFAIHFEPILFPISLLYVFWPDPRTLLVFQVLVVATGVFPAFLLARLRLRNDWAGVPFALLYLLYPAQQYAVDYDFHAVTLTLSLVLFALYFTYVRRNGWLFVFVVLSLACKEEIAGVVAMLGLWILVFQRRVRVGLVIVALACCWTALELLIVHYFSPVGHSLLASRWSDLGDSPAAVVITILTHPIQIIQQNVLEPSHQLYLRKLLAPAGYLPLLAPWVLVMALPTLALNLLSSTPNMYSGDFQYNAEIVPILIFSTIEATVLLLWLLQRLLRALQLRRGMETAASSTLAEQGQPGKRPGRRLQSEGLLRAGGLVLILAFILLSVFNASGRYNVYSAMPYARGFIWPQENAHDRLAYRFLGQIPATASVTTQTALVPHLSERESIYLFPYGAGYAEYILLDAPGYYYPFQNYDDYAHEVKAILLGGAYGVVDMQDGYLLLKKGYSTAANQSALQMIDMYRHTDGGQGARSGPSAA
jgi:uncharacterized membrane protein